MRFIQDIKWPRRFAARLTVVALCALLGTVIAAWAGWFPLAQTQEIFTGEPIADIRIEGNQRVEPETVRSYMQLAPGDPFSAERIDRALKNLFATGLFADVTFRREGGVLVVQVTENPIISQVAFEGNRRIRDEDLQSEVQLRPRSVYTQARVQADVKRILDIYRRSGRFAATVEPKVIARDQNRIDLVFEINEGQLTRVQRIDFVGNRVFSDGTLREEISTSESAWWRFLSNTDSYDPDRLEVDKEELRAFYLREGYADFEVLSAVAELSPDREAFFITFTLAEGDRYKFGKIDVRSQLKDLDPVAVEDAITTFEGDWYNAEEVEKTVANLTDELGNLGYAFVQVDPRVERDGENKIINLTYDISEGPRVFVERIDIKGNVRTLDRVIRREFRIVEGDAFNASKIRRSRQRIQNLGFFQTVDIQNTPGSAPDKTVIEVNVQEQSTGSFSFGVGYSTTDGPLGNILIRERNLLGRGQDLQLSFLLSGRRSQAEISFTEPYFLDREISAGFDLYRTVYDRRESDFEERNLGGTIRFGYNISEFLKQDWSYSLYENDIFDVDEDASIAIRQAEGEVIVSTIGQTLSYDRRDNVFDPRDGYVIRLRNDVAGLGGDLHYLRSRATGIYYQPITDDVTASVQGDIGYIFGLGEDVRVADSFFLGGNSFRGFETAGVGPRDTETDDSLGGKLLLAGTVELAFPIGLPEEYGIRGRVFSDFGTLTDSDLETPQSVDTGNLRVSVGGGVTWRSPFGPLAVDVGFPILRDPEDERELFRFNAGARF